MMGVVYMATSATSGRAYVGSTTCDLEFRKDGHRRSANAGSDFPFHRAIRKHGLSDFTWCVLDEHEDAAGLRAAEEEWITRMDTFRNGYNATPLGAGGSVAGWSHTAATKAKMSAAHAARSDEEKERLRELKRAQMIGNTHGEALKGCKFTEEHRARISAALTGKPKSDAHRAALKGRKPSPETCAKISASMTGQKRPKQTPEHIAARVAGHFAAKARRSA